MENLEKPDLLYHSVNKRMDHAIYTDIQNIFNFFFTSGFLKRFGENCGIFFKKTSIIN